MRKSLGRLFGRKSKNPGDSTAGDGSTGPADVSSVPFTSSVARASQSERQRSKSLILGGLGAKKLKSSIGVQSDFASADFEVPKVPQAKEDILLSESTKTRSTDTNGTDRETSGDHSEAERVDVVKVTVTESINDPIPLVDVQKERVEESMALNRDKADKQPLEVGKSDMTTKVESVSLSVEKPAEKSEISQEEVFDSATNGSPTTTSTSNGVSTNDVTNVQKEDSQLEPEKCNASSADDGDDVQKVDGPGVEPSKSKNGKQTTIKTILPVVLSYDQIPLLEQSKLPRGGVSIETKGVGRVQVSWLNYI
jgi:hypothetical protein